MIDFRRSLGLTTCLVGVLVTLASCEGATYVNQHFTNRTEQPIFLAFRANEAATGWNLDTLWTIDPGSPSPIMRWTLGASVTIAACMRHFLMALTPCGWPAKP